MDREKVMKVILNVLKDAGLGSDMIPVGISNRHVHLSQCDLDTLFGVGYVLTKMKDLSQPEQYACKETVTICSHKGVIENLRILGPVRDKTQVEILAGDCFRLGVEAPLRLSGELHGTPGGVALIGTKGSVYLTNGLIVAKRHIHMSPDDAKRFGVHDGQIVSIEIAGERGGVYHNTLIRVSASFALECHLDVEEANSMGVTPATKISIRKIA